MTSLPPFDAVSFDCFGTLVAVDRPVEPAAAVADELREREVTIPDDWTAAYAEVHVEAPPDAEVALTDHVRAALSSRSVEAGPETVEAAVRAAFEPVVRTREGADRAVAVAAECGPVGVLSNCSVPGLVERALAGSAVDERLFDAVVTSVGCGWRKPDARAFAAVADALGVEPAALAHVGDDPGADGGARAAGAQSVLVGEQSLSTVADRLEGRRWA